MTLFKKLFLHSPFRYLAAFLISFGIGLTILIINGFDKLIYYVNAFSVGGAITFLVGLLALLSSLGAFDTFGYAFSTFRKRRHKDLYEYTLAKNEKRSLNRFTFVPYLVVGLLIFIVGMILFAIFTNRPLQ